MSRLQTVVVVDDDPDIRALAGLCLGHAGIEVHACESGAALFDYLDSHCPDMLVIDVMMPELDGPSTVQEMQRRHPDFQPAIVFLTGKVQVETREQLLALGAREVLRKPFSPLTLADELQEIYAD